MSAFVERYRTKGVVELEAIHWTGDNTAAIQEFAGTHSENGMAFEVFKDEGIDTAQLYDTRLRKWFPVIIGYVIIKDVMGFRVAEPRVFSAYYERH